MTLGTLSIFRGLGLVVSGGSPVSIDREITNGWFFTRLGEKGLGIWMSAWAMFAVALVGWFLFNQTAFGRRVQAIGSNRQAARYSGIRVNRYRIMVMSLMGFIVGIAATFLLAFQRGGNPASGPGQELYVIAATIIGGTALSGGSGSVFGAVIGAVEGIDCLWVGHFDLSLSMGIPAQFDHPSFLKAIEKVAQACEKHGKAAGNMVNDAKSAQIWKDFGYRAFACLGDVWLYQNALKQGLAELKASG